MVGGGLGSVVRPQSGSLLSQGGVSGLGVQASNGRDVDDSSGVGVGSVLLEEGSEAAEFEGQPWDLVRSGNDSAYPAVTKRGKIKSQM